MWMTFAIVVTTICTVLILLLPSRYHGGKRIPTSTWTGSNSEHGSSNCSVTVLVLGDIGRSPRMQYHALSIAKHGGEVQLVGYLDTKPLEELRQHSRVTIVSLMSNPSVLQTNHKLLFLILAPIKVIFQLLTLWHALAYAARPSKWLLVQNPPSIPTLLLAYLICFFRSTRLVIDWHNFGYSLLALKLGDAHPLVVISKAYEIVMAKTAFANLTVTNAMANIVKSEFVSQASVFTLHDRPAEIYQPIKEAERITFLKRYHLLTEESASIVDSSTRLLVSSTSWTADEDFSLFLNALCIYSRQAQESKTKLPKLVVVITGKGPLQKFYLDQIKELQQKGALRLVTIYTDWLSFEDYARLLGSADLGVSLHTSSSGVDLPMKVVDMFGAGLPVIGWSKFSAWSELVKEDINGKGFGSAEEMAEILCELFKPNSGTLSKLKKGALAESSRRWDDEWNPIAGKLFELTD